MPKIDDPLVTLLTEVRDLQREQVALLKKAQDDTARTRSYSLASLIFKIAMYVAVFGFSIAAAYYYAKTISGISGLMGM